MPKLCVGYRFLTEKEHAYISRLLWRTTMAILAARVGCKSAVISGVLKESNKQKMSPDMIARLMALKLEDFQPTRLRT